MQSSLSFFWSALATIAALHETQLDECSAFETNRFNQRMLAVGPKAVAVFLASCFCTDILFHTVFGCNIDNSAENDLENRDAFV